MRDSNHDTPLHERWTLWGFTYVLLSNWGKHYFPAESCS